MSRCCRFCGGRSKSGEELARDMRRQLPLPLVAARQLGPDTLQRSTRKEYNTRMLTGTNDYEMGLKAGFRFTSEFETA